MSNVIQFPQEDRSYIAIQTDDIIQSTIKGLKQTLDNPELYDLEESQKDIILMSAETGMSKVAIYLYEKLSELHQIICEMEGE